MNKKHVVMTLMLACASTGLFSQDVNPFNGSLNYGAPLLSLPSDRGNAIPITLSYDGNGINVYYKTLFANKRGIKETNLLKKEFSQLKNNNR